ncbi:Leucine--tRNA ligase [Gossypium australe]|uniref:Leucine--tRNA ligase n=1 Tax=Gossypium australe TaxID=47621 RepID=A0A5B6X281_9ROSI|nr:Leucine--tRNA ligase [Gossypium australe]
MPNLETSEVVRMPTVEAGNQGIRDDAMSQAMLKVLQRVVGAQTGSVGQGSMTERLWSNGAKKYVRARYIEARNLEFIRLKQCEKIVAEYEAEFPRLSRYTRTSRQERFFETLEEKTKVVENIKLVECGGREKDKNLNKGKRDSCPSGTASRPKKRAKVDIPQQYFALINIGSKYSYIASCLSGKLGISIEDIVINLSVVNTVFRRCLPEIQVFVFLLDMMELPFEDFNLIFGMD